MQQNVYWASKYPVYGGGLTARIFLVPPFPQSFQYTYLKILKSFFALCFKSDTCIDYTSHYKSGSSHAHMPSMVLNPSMVLHRHWLAELFMAKTSICKKKISFSIYIDFLFSFAFSRESRDFYITKAHKFSPNRELSPSDISSRA